MSKGLKFSFSNDLGYLTSCPVNVGTGLKVSVYVDLTGIVLLEQLSTVMQATKVLGYKSNEKGRKAGYKQIKNIKKSIIEKVKKVLDKGEIESGLNSPKLLTLYFLRVCGIGLPNTS
mgnify:CR=1 FL=1